MPFEIIQHPGDAILDVLPIVEVIYPAKPTAEDIASYDARARAIVDAQRRRPFCVLADQRALVVMPPELVSMLLSLNTYAASRGMLRSARLISSAMGGLQAQGLAREHRFQVRAFETRQEALVWLGETRASRP